MEVPAEVLQDLAGYVAQTNAALEKAASQEAEVAKMAPDTVNELIKAGLLDESQRDRAILTIQDPCKALESLQKTAAALVKQPVVSAMGKSEPAEKAASALTPMEEADRVFLERFGLSGN